MPGLRCAPRSGLSLRFREDLTYGESPEEAASRAADTPNVDPKTEIRGSTTKQEEESESHDEHQKVPERPSRTKASKPDDKGQQAATVPEKRGP